MKRFYEVEIGETGVDTIQWHWRVRYWYGGDSQYKPLCEGFAASVKQAGEKAEAAIAEYEKDPRGWPATDETDDSEGDDASGDIRDDSPERGPGGPFDETDPDLEQVKR